MSIRTMGINKKEIELEQSKLNLAMERITTETNKREKTEKSKKYSVPVTINETEKVDKSTWNNASDLHLEYWNCFGF